MTDGGKFAAAWSRYRHTDANEAKSMALAKCEERLDDGERGHGARCRIVAVDDEWLP